VQQTLDSSPSELGIARRERRRHLTSSTPFLVGSGILLFWIFWTIAGGRLTPQDPFAVSDHILRSPSGSHWFGTDALGRDVFSRVLTGGTSMLTVAPAATLLGVLAGTVIGLLVGFVGGVLDDVVGRVIDAVLALPLLVSAVLVIAAVGSRFHRAAYNDATTARYAQIFVIAAVFTPAIARTVRAAVLVERNLEYVDSARLLGESTLAIATLEVFPNVFGPIVVEGTVRLGYAMFTVASLRFLGFGAQPPSPDWALQVRDNYQLLPGGDWWPTLFAALAIATLVVGVNLIADGLADVLAT
jgi:peptide/nickel transport system permease protein